MPGPAARAVLTVGLLLPGTGCGGQERAASPAAPAGATSPGSTTPPSSDQEGTVTEDDDGGEQELVLGDEVALQLSSAWSWEVPVVTGDAVRLDPVDQLVDPGYAEWLVLAVAPGTAEVDVAGEPACEDLADCPARTVHLTVRVAG